MTIDERNLIASALRAARIDLPEMLVDAVTARLEECLRLDHEVRDNLPGAIARHLGSDDLRGCLRACIDDWADVRSAGEVWCVAHDLAAEAMRPAISEDAQARIERRKQEVLAHAQ